MSERQPLSKSLARTIMLPLLLTGLLATILVIEVERLLLEAEWLNHSDQVISASYQTQKELLDRETSIRGFLLTKDSAFISMFNSEGPSVEGSFQRLIQLSSDNHIQSKRLDSIQQLYFNWEASAKRDLDYIGNDSITILSLMARKHYRDTIKTLFDHFNKVEDTLRESRLNSFHFASNIVFIIGIGISLLFGAIIALNGRKQLQTLTRDFEKVVGEATSNRDLLMTTLLSIGDAIIVTDADGNVTLMNHIAENLTGWHMREAKGRSIHAVFNVIDATTRQSVANPIDAAIAQEHIIQLKNHTLLISRHGLEIPIEDSAAPIKDASRSTMGAVLVFRDVSERKSAESELSIREREFRELIENAPDIIARYDRQMRLSYVNPAIELAYGINARAAIGKRLNAVGVTPQESNVIETEIERVFASGKPTSFDYESHTVRGLRSYQARLVPELNEHGQVESVLSVARDISELKRTENRLKESEERFRSVVESNLNGFYVLRAERDINNKIIDFTFTYVNEQGAKLTAFTREEIIGKRLLSLIPAEVSKPYLDRYSEVVESGIPQNDEQEMHSSFVKARWIAQQIVKLGDGVAITSADITERRNLEETVKQHEAEFRALVENSPDVIVRYGPGGRFLYVNPAMETVAGLTAKQMLGKTPMELGIPTEFYQPFLDRLRHVFYAKEPIIHQEEYPSAQGTRYFQTRLVPELGSDGEVKSVLATSRDVTDFKEAERQLRHSEERFRKIVENSLDSFYLFKVQRDSNGKPIDLLLDYVNQHGADLTTFTRDEMVGKPLGALIPTRRTAEYIQKLFEIIESKEPLIEEYSIASPIVRDARWLLSQYVPIDDSIAITTSDITHRKEIEIALRESEERYRHLIENTSEAIFSTDVEGNITYANPYIRNISGFSLEDALSLNYLDLVAPEYRSKAQRFFFRQFLAKEHSTTAEFPFQTKDNSTRWLSLTSTLRKKKGIVEGFDFIATDITAKVEAERELREAKEQAEAMVKAQSEALSTLLEHIKKPIRDVVDSAQKLERNLKNSEAFSQAQELSESSIKLANLLQDSLMFVQKSPERS